MSRKSALLEELSLNGLEVAPPQVSGAIRLFPLLRHQVKSDLRLFPRTYGEDLTIVDLGAAERASYYAYVPHGLVVSWSDDGNPVAARGGQLLKPDGKGYHSGPTGVRLLHRMARREAGNQLRLLPMHLAMEGFLGLYFSGPDIAWQDYSRQVLSNGLGSRWEVSYLGRAIAGLEAALRLFEIHEHQVGVLIFVAEALASAFVVPTPTDYRALHKTVLADFYGELMFQYGQIFETTVKLQTEVDTSQIQTLAGLKQIVSQMRTDWADVSQLMTAGLLRQLRAQRVYALGPFSLQRFITQLRLDQENHIGEAIVRADGEVEYLKTFRLSGAQTRRAYLLSQLAAHNWELNATAQTLGHTREELVLRLEKAGFGYLLNNTVREQAHAKLRRR